MIMQFRQAPARFFEGAPDIVKAQVLDFIKVIPAAPLEFDVLLCPASDDREVTGVDFGQRGARGCHFSLKPHEARAYRDRNRRKRAAWSELPEPTQRAIVAYLEWNPEA
jgi:hypothetical protein|tara:strand:- start:752 stop:1078 length:327 start_codon:yes stop_codon:yes gene_type:complete